MSRVCYAPDKRDSTRTQSFTYDQLNRIATAKTSATTGSNCWGETYTIDQWGNLTVIGALSGCSGCTVENLSVSATTNNQLSATGFSYDSSGNMLTDGANTYGYNAESEIKSAARVNYTYDGDGNRVEKSNGKIYWYGAGFVCAAADRVATKTRKSARLNIALPALEKQDCSKVLR